MKLSINAGIAIQFFMIPHPEPENIAPKPVLIRKAKILGKQNLLLLEKIFLEEECSKSASFVVLILVKKFLAFIILMKIGIITNLII